MMTVRFCLLFVALVMVSVSRAQDKRSRLLENEGDGGIGGITLTDGTVLRGKLTYNDNIGAVKLEDTDNPRVFKPHEVASFNFYSERFLRDKNFLSLEFHDPDVDKTDIFFFEVLREFKTFAVLTRVGGIKTEIVSNGAGYPYYINNNRVMATQTETVYFFADDGRILPYLKIVERETEDAIADWNRTKNKFIDKSLFEQFTGPHYAALLQFADEHQLSFKSKEHLVKILDRYAALVE